MQICYNLLFQHPYEPSRPFGCMLAAEEAGMGVLTMRTATSGTLQRWIRTVNPADDFDYTPALIQFVLSNPYVDVALVGMRTPSEVLANLALVDDLEGRIDLGALHGRYVQPTGIGRT
jgi:predicted aldo/keto reductase-like oxidoreductase